MTASLSKFDMIIYDFKYWTSLGTFSCLCSNPNELNLYLKENELNLMLNISQIKPVRESMNEALQLWKKIAGKGDGSSDEQRASSHGRH